MATTTSNAEVDTGTSVTIAISAIVAVVAGIALLYDSCCKKKRDDGEPENEEVSQLANQAFKPTIQSMFGNTETIPSFLDRTIKYFQLFMDDFEFRISNFVLAIPDTIATIITGIIMADTFPFAEYKQSLSSTLDLANVRVWLRNVEFSILTTDISQHPILSRLTLPEDLPELSLFEASRTWEEYCGIPGLEVMQLVLHAIHIHIPGPFECQYVDPTESNTGNSVVVDLIEASFAFTFLAAIASFCDNKKIIILKKWSSFLGSLFLMLALIFMLRVTIYPSEGIVIFLAVPIGKLLSRCFLRSNLKQQIDRRIANKSSRTRRRAKIYMLVNFNSLNEEEIFGSGDEELGYNNKQNRQASNVSPERRGVGNPNGDIVNGTLTNFSPTLNTSPKKNQGRTAPDDAHETDSQWNSDRKQTERNEKPETKKKFKTFQISVPANSKPGDKIKFTGKDGIERHFLIPEGLSPGDCFRVQVPRT